MTLCVLIVAILAGCPCFSQTAHDYFQELYEAGGLDRMADGYVCFDDSKDLKRSLFLSCKMRPISASVRWMLFCRVYEASR